MCHPPPRTRLSRELSGIRTQDQYGTLATKTPKTQGLLAGTRYQNLDRFGTGGIANLDRVPDGRGRQTDLLQSALKTTNTSAVVRAAHYPLDAADNT